MSRDVYLNPPVEAQCDKSILWKLNKCIYGLSDASLQWYHLVKKFILSCGGKVSKSDPTLFLWHKSNELHGIIIIHVDDFLWAGSDEFKNNVIEKLCKKYVVSKFESPLFRFVGLNLKQQNNTITIEQYKYIERIKMIEIDTKRKIQHNEPLTEQEKTVLRSKIGQLLWVNNQTRPGISFELCHLSTNFENATVNDIIQTNKVIKKLKQSPGHVTYVPIENDPKIIVYTDASFGNLVDSGSQGAFLIFLVDRKQNYNLISWQSKRIRRVTKSSLAAETLSLSEGLDNAYYVASLYNEILYNGNENLFPNEAYIDNKSLFNSLQSTKMVSERRLRLDISAIKEMLSSNEIVKIDWLPTEKQLSNSLTKQGANTHHLISYMRNGCF